MKKSIIVITTLIYLFSLAACGIGSKAGDISTTVTPTDELVTEISTEDTEILRAIDYGFVPGELLSDWDSTITFNQYCSMLKNMLNLYDSALVPQWENTAELCLASNGRMLRDHGMVATYYAATLMGLGHTTNGNWNYMDQVVEIDKDAFFSNDFSKSFPDSRYATEFYDNEYKKHIPGWNYLDSARLWIMGQTSPVSGKLIFDIDLDKKSNRPLELLTRQEAIRAVLRLYESTFKPVDNLAASDAQSKEILSLAEERRTSIVNSPTMITKSDTFVQGETYTGTAYYVSVNGDDSNDGKTPETAWASMEKVNSANLVYGDAVFFNRGDAWYEQLWGQAGVTYSAYGTGQKPIISGSVEENAADPAKWELYFAGDAGEKIWVYYRDLLNVTAIVFNDGESWANKVYPFWDGGQYVFNTGESFTAANGLTEDLDFFSAIDLTKIDPLERVSESGVSGPVYLRSDAGNPGDVYAKIEFSQDGTGISPLETNGKDMTVDNLHVEYFGMLGISSAGYQGWTNTIIQNSEIGWCGGGITYYDHVLSDEYAFPYTSGGAIQMSGVSNTAVNNYIHHVANKTFVLAIHDRESVSFIYSDIMIKGNLLEYNAASLHLADYMDEENPNEISGFKNINYTDNIVLYTGYGWVDLYNQRSDLTLEGIHTSVIECGGFCKNENEGVYITDNIFYMAKYAILHCYMPEENQMVFSGNTYAQSENGWLALLRGRLLSVTENGEDYVKNDLMDATGKVVVIR